MQNIVLDNNYEFIYDNTGKAHIYFSTAKNGVDFNIAKKEGINSINRIKEVLGLKDIYFLKQIHSDLIFNYDDNIHQGDAIICENKNVAIGVFTADCAPILIYDTLLNIISAVHSGWRGTLSMILSKTIDKMKQEYGSKAENLKVYIGPHNRSCCYEVGAEVIDKFNNSEFYRNKDIFHEKNLNIKQCLLYQLEYKNIPKENIIDINQCTYCNKEYNMHSYRKDAFNAGRMFSFIYVK